MADFIDLLLPLSHWSWWIAAIVLIVLELAAPGVAFLWLGIAAGLVGLLVYFMPALDWKSQLAVFAVFAVVSVIASRRYLRWKPLETDRPNLNRRGDSYIGREFALDQDLAGGTGTMKVDDSRWQIAGPDLPAGAKVKVTGVEGATMQVVAASAALEETVDDAES